MRKGMEKMSEEVTQLLYNMVAEQGDKIDKLEEKVDDKIDKLEEKVDDKINKLEEKVDELLELKNKLIAIGVVLSVIFGFIWDFVKNFFASK